MKLISAAALVACVTTASAAELTVMSAGAAQAGLTSLLAEYQRRAGRTLTIQYATGPELATRVAAGQVADILIAPAAVVDQAATDGHVVRDARTTIGRVGVGVMVRGNVPVPNIATSDALRQTLLKADAVVYSQGSTGIYVDKLLADMGIAEQIRTKVKRYARGADVAEHIVSGTGNEIGLSAITELKMFTTRGGTFVGPLPSAIQNYTTYVAARMTHAASPEAANDFLTFLTTPPARQAFAASGVE